MSNDDLTVLSPADTDGSSSDEQNNVSIITGTRKRHRKARANNLVKARAVLTDLGITRKPGPKKQSSTDKSSLILEWKKMAYYFARKCYNHERGNKLTPYERFGILTLHHVMWDQNGKASASLVQFCKDNENTVVPSIAAKAEVMSGLLKSKGITLSRPTIDGILKQFVDSNEIHSKSAPVGVENLINHSIKDTNKNFIDEEHLQCDGRQKKHF